MTPEINLNDLSRKQLIELCMHRDSFLDVLIATHNALILKIRENPACNNEIIDILNNWSVFCDGVSKKSAEEISRILAPRDGSIN